jgi:hypothetical protein
VRKKFFKYAKQILNEEIYDQEFLNDYLEKENISLDLFKENVSYIKEIYSFQNEKDEECSNRYCARCVFLKLIGYDDIIFENILQCQLSKEIYGRFYNYTDNLTTSFCAGFRTSSEISII